MTTSEDEARHSGGCLCGALRYEARGKPRAMGHCYCEDCRKASGSGFIPFMMFPSGAVRVSGRSLSFASEAANGGEATRNFCPACGGLVFGGELGSDTTLNIYAGSLDDPSAFRPTLAIFTRGRPDWATIPPGLSTFERAPDRAARADEGSRLIKADAATIYRALIDPKAVAAWRPPAGMTSKIHAFEPRPGGAFRMSFIYAAPDHRLRGKTTEHADTVQGRFVELVPNERVVERASFESDDPAFAGEMTVTTRLDPAPGGTKVTISCANVPAGIDAADHAAGIASTLANLAAFVE